MNVVLPWFSLAPVISVTKLAHQAHAVRILGVDPGLRRTGFGVIETQGSRLRYIRSGTIVVPPELPLAERLHQIFSCLSEVAADTQATQAALEIVFFNTNPASSLLLGHARGAILCALANQQLPVSEYTALQIKKSVVGTGRAAKEQVQLMVQKLLNLSGVPSPDSADALACAICHAHTQPLQDKLAQHSVSIAIDGKARIRQGRLVR